MKSLPFIEIIETSGLVEDRSSRNFQGFEAVGVGIGAGAGVGAEVGSVYIVVQYSPVQSSTVQSKHESGVRGNRIGIGVSRVVLDRVRQG